MQDAKVDFELGSPVSFFSTISVTPEHSSTWDVNEFLLCDLSLSGKIDNPAQFGNQGDLRNRRSICIKQNSHRFSAKLPAE